MIHKKILLSLCLCCCWLITTAQLPQRQSVTPSKPSRVNSVFLGVSGGMSVPFSFIAHSQSVGGFGQAEVFVFLTENITSGTNIAYHYFPGKKNYYNIDMWEVLINGAYHFNHRLNPHISLGLGYYGEPGTSHFGMVPGIGIMPKINNWFYLKARASASFFNIDGHFFKIEAGFTFMVFKHKPIPK